MAVRPDLPAAMDGRRGLGKYELPSRQGRQTDIIQPRIFQ